MIESSTSMSDGSDFLDLSFESSLLLEELELLAASHVNDIKSEQ